MNRGLPKTHKTRHCPLCCTGGEARSYQRVGRRRVPVAWLPESDDQPWITNPLVIFEADQTATNIGASHLKCWTLFIRSILVRLGLGSLNPSCKRPSSRFRGVVRRISVVSTILPSAEDPCSAVVVGGCFVSFFCLLFFPFLSSLL